MQTLIEPLLDSIQQMQANVPTTLYIIAGLFAIHMVNRLTGGLLNIFGIIPRKWYGLPGVVCSPFLHGDFNHLFFNAIPLFVLMNLVLLEGWQPFLIVTASITVLSGLAVWLVARPSIHIGASGLIMGYWSYLLAQAIHQETFMSIILALVCIYYFGGFFFQIVPTKKGVSWEAHLFGVLAGFAVAYLLPWLGLSAPLLSQG